MAQYAFWKNRKIPNRQKLSKTKSTLFIHDGHSAPSLAKTKSTFAAVGPPEGGSGGRVKRSSIRRPQRSMPRRHVDAFQRLSSNGVLQKLKFSVTYSVSNQEGHPLRVPTALRTLGCEKNSPPGRTKIGPKSHQKSIKKTNVVLDSFWGRLGLPFGTSCAPKSGQERPKRPPRSPQEAPRSLQDPP